MRRAFFVAVLLVATEATGLRAQSKIGTEFHPYNLSDTIVVSANRLATPVRTSGSSITVITADQIEKSQAVMAADVLRDVPGVSVVQSGGPGQQTSVFMRGANSEHTLVIIDGVEINDPSSPNTAANLNNLPADNIERIEILRGPQSVLYGSDAVGGVIQIFTRRGLGRPVVTVSSEAGSFNTFREHVAIRSGRDDIDYTLSVTRQDTDGISAAQTIDTVHDGDGGSVVRTPDAERDGYNNTTLSVSFGLRPSDRVEMRFAGRMTQADTDLDQGGGVLDDPNYTMNSRERFLSGQISHDLLESTWGHRLGFFITHYKRSTTDATDTEHPFDANETKFEGRRVKFDWQHVLRLKDVGRLTAGMEAGRDEAEQSLFFASMFGDYYSSVRDARSRTTGLYVLADLNPGHNWSATFGLRRDDHNRFGSETTYRITAAYNLEPLGVNARASFGTAFKAPSLVQLHDPVAGNPNLLPESSEGWDLGFEKELVGDQLRVGMTYFHTSFTQLFRYNSFAGGMENVASVSSRGGEIFGEFKTSRMSVRFGYTNTLTRDDSDPLKQKLLRRPRHQLSLAASAQPTGKLNLGLSISHKGRRPDLDFSVRPSRRVILQDYTRVHLRAAYQVLPDVEVHGRIENLLDTEYEEVLNYGSAPISAHIGFRVTLQ